MLSGTFLYKCCVALNRGVLADRKDTVWRSKLKASDDCRPVCFIKPRRTKDQVICNGGSCVKDKSDCIHRVSFLPAARNSFSLLFGVSQAAAALYGSEHCVCSLTRNGLKFLLFLVLGIRRKRQRSGNFFVF